MNPRKNPLDRSRLWVLCAVAGLAGLVVSGLTRSERTGGAISHAQDAKAPKGEQKIISLLYTINNLGYTSTCG